MEAQSPEGGGITGRSSLGNVPAGGGGIADGIEGEDSGGCDDDGIGDGDGGCDGDGITGAGRVGFWGAAVIVCSHGGGGPPGAGDAGPGDGGGDACFDGDCVADGATSSSRSGAGVGCDRLPPGWRAADCGGAGGGGFFVAQQSDNDRIANAVRADDMTCNLISRHAL